MKRIRLINLILIMFCCCNMLAQNITVTGQVVDVTSEPIISASVVVKVQPMGLLPILMATLHYQFRKGNITYFLYRICCPRCKGNG